MGFSAIFSLCLNLSLITSRSMAIASTWPSFRDSLHKMEDGSNEGNRLRMSLGTWFRTR
jgi:hypothetical protein